MSDQPSLPMANVKVTIQGRVPIVFLAEMFDGIRHVSPQDGKFTFEVDGER